MNDYPDRPPTPEETLTLLEEAVAEKGDGYVYPEYGEDGLRLCWYVVDDEPSCIVGHVLHKYGVPLADLHKSENVNASQMLTHLWGQRRHRGATDTMLNAAQIAQDSKRPWGQALVEAKEAYAEVRESDERLGRTEEQS